MTLRLKLLLLSLFSVIFLAISFHRLSLPGYYYDEGLYALPALDFITPAPGDPSPRWIPVMLSSYFGATQTYCLVPFLKLAGGDYRTSRVVPILFACIAVWLTWWFCELLFNGPTALLACTFLISSPSYIFWSRTGLAGEGPLLTVFYLLVLIFLAKWYFEEKPCFLYGAALIAGIGLYTKLNFGIVICGLFLTSLVYARHLRKVMTARDMAIAVLLFVIGASPLIIYNLAHHGATAKLLLDAVTGDGLQGVDNTRLGYHLLIRAKHLISLLGGNAYDLSGSMVANPAVAAVFCAGLACLTLFAFTRRARLIHAGRIKALLVLQGTLFLGNCFTVSGFVSFHLFYLLAPCFILAAVFFYALLRPANRITTAVVAVSIAAMIALNGKAVINIYAYLDKTGGEGLWSDAVYSLAGVLRDNAISRPIAMDWGIKKSVQVLAHNAVFIEEATDNFNKPPDEHFSARCEKYIADPGTHYIFIADPYAKSGKRRGYYAAFYRIVQYKGGVLRTIQEFKDRTGRTVYTLCAVARP